MQRDGLYLSVCIAALAAAVATPAAATAQTAPSAAAPQDQDPAPAQPASPPADPAAAPATAAPAAPEQGGLKEIVVTAQRRSENLQNVPIAVTALSAETLATKGITDVKLLATGVPSLTFTTQANLASPRIRGVGAASAGAGNENPVSLYVDGVYYASAGASVLAFNNIAQVAVLKGPQGTLFGRNATGGLIQITTRDPSRNFSGRADLTYGNHNTFGGNLYVTGGTDGLAADLAVHYRNQRDGFGTNLFNGRDVNNNRDIALRSKIQAKPDDRTTFTLILDYDKSHSNSPAYRLVSGELGFDGKYFMGGKFDVDTNIQPRTNVEQYGAAFIANRDLDFARLISITAYRHSNFHGIFDADGQPEDYISGDVNEPGRQFSQEVQLVSKSGGRFTWQAGLFYFWMRDGFIPTTVPLPLFGISSHILTIQHTKSYAAYAQGTYKIDDLTSLTVGGRLTHENKYITGSGELEILGTPSFFIPQGPYSSKLSVTKPTWRFALDHKLARNVLVYVSYNRGFKSGGFDPSSTAAAVPFKPEVLDAFELGLKSEFLDHKLRLNAATFYYDYKNIQLNSYRNGVTFIYNGKSAKVYGLDLDITAAPTEHLTLTGGLSLLHDRFGDFPISYTAVLPGGGIAPLPDASAKGKRLQNTPDWQLNAGIQYQIPLPVGGIALSADFFHSGRWYSTPENRLFQKAYNLVNAAATWTIDRQERYTLQAWGRNLGNVAYAEQLTTQVPVADFVNMAEGRTFGVTLGAKF